MVRPRQGRLPGQIFEVRAFGSAPWANSFLTSSTLPACAAKCRDVAPIWSALFTLAPFAEKNVNNLILLTDHGNL